MSASVASSSRRRSIIAGSPSVSSNGSTYASTAGASTTSSRLVTRLALEGKVKNHSREVEMKMYMKISIPWDYANSGTTHQLFPEENLKIISTIVHPLDSASAPYKFSPNEFPLLQSATRLLNLPPMLDESFTSLFPLSYDRQPSYLGSSSRSSSSNGVTHAVDAKYTGHMTVSGYNVSYVMPREFPPLEERNSQSAYSNAKHKRRSSVGERGAYQYLIAITMLVPFLSIPPRAPFMLSIPVPRCLSNNIKLRIYTPKAKTSGSYASISSNDEDNMSWELMSDPPVARSISHSRHKSYPSKDADDESSEASTAGFSEGCSLRGTFPSTDKLQIRWANTPRGSGAASNHSRRLVGVEAVQGETTCAIIGKGKIPEEGSDALLMKIEHKATCKNVWYAGVAIHLGMDLSLDTNSCQFEWPDNTEPGWTVTGGTGFTGWDTGDNPEPFSRPETPYSPFELEQSSYASNPRQRLSSRSSSSSLIRTPLTPPEVPEYSFESSPSTPTGSMMSSMGSLARPDLGPGFDRSPLPDGKVPIPNPASPVIVHLNMDDLTGASTKEGFSFQVSGVVLVRPRYPSTKVNLHDSTTVTPVVGLPRFRVHTAEEEFVSVTVKNETLDDAIEVFHPTGDIRDAQTRRTVLQRGAVARCGVEGARVALRSTAPLLHSRSTLNQDDSMAETTVPNYSANSPERRLIQPSAVGKGIPPVLHSSATPRYTLISHIRADVILLPASEPDTTTYVVSVSFVAPATMGDDDFEWGIARPEAITSVPVIQDLVVSANGLVVHLSATNSQASTGLGIQGVFKQFNAREKTDWLQWIKMDSMVSPGSTVMLQYTVKLPELASARHSSRKAGFTVPIILPSFAMAFARLDVDVRTSQDMTISSRGDHNLAVHYTTPDGPRWTRFSTDELFRPSLTVTIGPVGASTSNPNAPLVKRILMLLPAFLTVLVLLKAVQVEQQLQHLNPEGLRDVLFSVPDIPPSLTIAAPPPTTSTDPADNPYTTDSAPTHWGESAPETASPEAPTHIPTTPATSESAAPPPFPVAMVKEAPTIAHPITTISLPEWSPIPDDVAVRLPQPDLLHFVRSKLPQSEDVTYAISQGLRKAWRWWQIVVNFPLPPPDD